MFIIICVLYCWCLWRFYMPSTVVPRTSSLCKWSTWSAGYMVSKYLSSGSRASSPRLFLGAIPHFFLSLSPFFRALSLCPIPLLPSHLIPFYTSLGILGRAPVGLPPSWRSPVCQLRDIFESLDAIFCSALVNSWGFEAIFLFLSAPLSQMAGNTVLSYVACDFSKQWGDLRLRTAISALLT